MDQFDKTQNDQSNFWICCRNIFAHQIDVGKCVSSNRWWFALKLYALSIQENAFFLSAVNDSDDDDDDSDDEKWSWCVRASVCVRANIGLIKSFNNKF